jgi:hypothetical protein
MIDRESPVRRHTVELAEADASCGLTVGNGDFAFTADITGMQTFTGFHDPAAAGSERPAVNTTTISAWGWHAIPNPEGFVLTDAMSIHDTPRGPVEYLDKFTMTALYGGEVPDEYRAGVWLHVNPQRLDLRRTGLVLRRGPDAAPESDPSALRNPRQRLDLWTGGTHQGQGVAFRKWKRLAWNTRADWPGASVAVQAQNDDVAGDGGGERQRTLVTEKNQGS